jgi:hypothetical protein
MTTQRGIRGVARAAGILAPTNGLTVSSRRQTSGPLPKFIPPPRETAPDVGNSPGAAVSGWTSKGVNAGALGSAAFESQSLDLGTESPVDEGSLCVGALAEGPVISVCLSDRIGPAGMATWQGLLFSASDGRLGDKMPLRVSAPARSSSTAEQPIGIATSEMAFAGSSSEVIAQKLARTGVGSSSNFGRKNLTGGSS